MAKKKTLHVVKNPSGGWSVKKSGASRASGTYKTQKDAVASANKISKKKGTRVVVHGKDYLLMLLFSTAVIIKFPKIDVSKWIAVKTMIAVRNKRIVEKVDRLIY